MKSEYVIEKIDERIKALEKDLDRYYNDRTPVSSPFFNPMSAEYASERRDEIRILTWVKGLFKEWENLYGRVFIPQDKEYFGDMTARKLCALLIGYPDDTAIYLADKDKPFGKGLSLCNAFFYETIDGCIVLSNEYKD